MKELIYCFTWCNPYSVIAIYDFEGVDEKINLKDITGVITKSI